MTQSFRDTLYTINSAGKRQWVYPHYLPGRHLRRRTVVAYSLMVFYLLLPWITIRGKQGVLLDIPHRRFIFFGLEFWATDTIFLFLVLASLGMCLFLFTGLLGRVWCGWACPETVFLEFLFRPIERLIEGSDAERRRLDNARWTARKIIKKLLKHGLCAIASWIIASTALAYFVGREPLLEMMQHHPLLNPQPFFLTLAVMGLMAFQFGWFREQFCTVLCPYARFQSVLMDQDSLLVGYDVRRGEPRGKVRVSGEEKNGDCIDCGMCVRVCPTGIDIRNGTQLECIACAACVDACDSIMQKVNRPPGLIRYDTEARLLGRSTRIFRPRLAVYLAIIFVLAGTFVTLLSTRDSIDVDVLRMGARSELVTVIGESVSNQFSVRLANKGSAPQRVVVELLSPQFVSFVSPLHEVNLEPRAEAQLPIFLQAPRSAFRNGTLPVRLQVSATDGVKLVREIVLMGPQE